MQRAFLPLHLQHGIIILLLLEYKIQENTRMRINLRTGLCNYYTMYMHRETKPSCMLCLGELWHCTSPGSSLASRRYLPRSLTSGVLCQRTGARPNGKKLAWLQDPSSHSSYYYYYYYFLFFLIYFFIFLDYTVIFIIIIILNNT